MKTLTEQECSDWCAQRNVVGPKRHLRPGAASGAVFTISLPKLGLDAIGLSAVLSAQLEDTGHPKTLLWLTDWGMWSEEYDVVGIRLWEHLLRSTVHGASIAAWPGIVFEESETIDQRVFLVTGMLYQWDVVLVPDHGNYIVRVSHDGDVFVMVRDGYPTTSVAKAIGGWTNRRA